MAVDLGDPELGALLTFLDLALAKDREKPERQHAFLVHLRGCIDSRIVTAESAVRRQRGKTPPPRRPSGAFVAQHSRAETEPHNTRRLVDRAEAEREFGERTTPVCPLEPVLSNTHPGRERDR